MDLKTTITRKGQTVIPAKIRKKYGMSEGVTIQWIDTGETITVVPIQKGKIRTLRGIVRGGKLLEKLLHERNVDRDCE